MTETIPLTCGKFAIVDDDDYERLMQWKWRAMPSRHTFYAIRSEWGNGGNVTMLMHREITKPEPGYDVHHRNGNGLDNRRANLEVCRHDDHVRMRSHAKRAGTSGHVGVYWCKDRRKWRAWIRVDGKQKHLGCFEIEEDAACAVAAALAQREKKHEAAKESF